MRKILIQSLVGSGLAFGALTLGAQQYNPQQYPPQGDYQRYDRGGDRDHDRNMLLNRVRSDLDRAQTRAVAGDRWQIARAKDTLGDFQSRLNSGQVDRRELHAAIDNVQRVVDANRLPYRLQQNLSDDLNRLRDMQYRLGA
jgi:hypothetical protein